MLPRLVHSRFGLHVVEVLAREPGTAQSYEACAAPWRWRCASYPTSPRCASTCGCSPETPRWRAWTSTLPIRRWCNSGREHAFQFGIIHAGLCHA